MRTLLFFAITCFLSTFTMLANLGEPKFFLIAIALWMPFIQYMRRRQKRIDACRRRNFLREQCYRVYLRKNGYRY